MKLKLLLLIFSHFSLYTSFSQSMNHLYSGFNFRIIYQTGSHEKSLGIQLNTYLNYRFFQINASSGLSYYPYSFGNRKKMIEYKNALGLVAFFGKKRQFIDWQLNPLVKQSKHDYALSYASIWYKDNVGTSQRSGAFGVQLKRISLIHENDAFAGIATDRFRTGLFRIQWNDSLFKLTSGLSIWTGETTGVPKQINPNLYPKAFKDISSLPYGKTSHGIWFNQIQLRFMNDQTLSLQSGIDSEHIRHLVQNRFFHDLPFLPKKYQYQTAHYPRLNDQGMPAFKKEETKKNKYYYSVGFNPN